MKTYLLLIFMGLTSVVNHSIAQTPKIEFKQKIICLDTVDSVSPNEATFTFKNTGTGLLIISDVISSCGCTTPIWSKKPIRPGGYGTLTARYTKPGTNSFRKTILVKSNASNANKVVLQIYSDGRNLSDSKRTADVQ